MRQVAQRRKHFTLCRNCSKFEGISSEELVFNWAEFVEHLNNTINQPFFVQHAHESFTNPIIKIVRSLQMVESITTNGHVFNKSKQRAIGYKIVNGQEMNSANPADRFLLLEEINDKDGVVIDFGNVKPYNRDQLLYYFDAADKFPNYVLALHILLCSLNNWVKVTGRRLFVFE